MKQLAHLLLLIIVTQIYVLEAKNNKDETEYDSAFSRDGIVFSVGKMNWFAAYGFCTQLGMELLTLESSVDNREFQKMAQHYKLQNKNYWLAANRLEDNTTFRWGLRGRPLSFENWQLGQPDNKGGNQRCSRLYVDHQWDDVDCFTEFPVICHY
ncbi:C-type lectin 37Db [Bactrocera oleae]|uniref:C-type lectin 37Db n=1 Tax=Bactrocera oleae TaxID=104688 RepID=UPI00387E6CB0